MEKKIYLNNDLKMAGAWPDMAADQDVPLQADHHQPGQYDHDDDDDDDVDVNNMMIIIKMYHFKQININ